MMAIFENASETMCRRDASRTDMHGRKLPESMLKNRINRRIVTQAIREVLSMVFGGQVL